MFISLVHWEHAGHASTSLVLQWSMHWLREHVVPSLDKYPGQHQWLNHIRVYPETSVLVITSHWELRSGVMFSTDFSKCGSTMKKEIFWFVSAVFPSVAENMSALGMKRDIRGQLCSSHVHLNIPPTVSDDSLEIKCSLPIKSDDFPFTV